MRGRVEAVYRGPVALNGRHRREQIRAAEPLKFAFSVGHRALECAECLLAATVNLMGAMPKHALFSVLPFAPLGAHVPRLTITAEQAKELRDGSAEVWALQNSKHQYQMSVHAAFRVPGDTAEAHVHLGKLKIAGTTTIDGRKAIKPVPVHGRGEYDVTPGTHYPIREVVEDSPGSRLTFTWSEYRVLPATRANERLLSLAARHPGARIDHSRADFLVAWARLMRGD